ncbi:MAG: hypothetical protein M1377_05120 [Deltaproteobacteria bacterium]|nr:hypothetical protein [Deltaproteobacteria bacterium]
MDLFVASFPLAKWDKILALRNQDTAKAKVFRALLSGGWIPGEKLEAAGGGWDFRTRASRLRDLGIPVESRSVTESPCNQYRIPQAFLLAFQEKERQKWRAA